MTAPGNWSLNERDRSWRCDAGRGEATAFHRMLPDYAPTRIVDLPSVAVDLGVRRVVAKDESSRLGLPAFKALGASWAMHQARRGDAAARETTFVTATDGNHGRAVAHFAKRGRHRAAIFVPVGVHPNAITAIEDEGAEVHIVDADYDGAVRTAAAHADFIGGVLVQDTAWPGYTTVPGWIVDGYSTMFVELDDQLAVQGSVTDVLVVPTGVGSLLQAALVHYRSRPDAGRCAIASVEPETAACVRDSIRAGRPVTVRTDRTVMAGMNCGTVSTAAWPFVAAGLDAALTVSDAAALTAARYLAEHGVSAGPCGAAALGALRSARQHPDSTALFERLGLHGGSTLVLLVTEGSAANPNHVDN